MTEGITDNAESIGFDAGRLARAEAVLRRAIMDGIFPGCSVAVGAGEKTAWKAGYGLLEPGASAVTPDTPYDLASLTKPLACASSIIVLLERGELCLTDEVRRFFPGPPLPHLRGVTLHHLLTHTSGLPAWEKLYARGHSPEEVISGILQISLEAPPGERYAYSDLGYILLGEIVRRVGGKRLDDFAREEVFRPLGMNHTGFWALDGGGQRFMGLEAVPGGNETPFAAPTRHCPLREGKTLVAEVHDANCSALNGVSGHAGLFGTAEEVAHYLQMLLAEGTGLDGSRFFSPAAVRCITTAQINAAVGGQSLGWFTPPNGMHTGGDLWAKTGFSHSGFTGTSAFGDPATGVFVVLLTNAVYFSTGEHLRVRRQFHNAVAGACRLRAGGE